MFVLNILNLFSNPLTLKDCFNHLSRLYFNKASGAILVCDQASEASLEGIVKWKKELDDKLYDTPTVLMVNKSDLMAKTDFVVSKEDIEMEELANDLDICSWTRTSAKTGHGVEDGIRYIYIKVMLQF